MLTIFSVCSSTQIFYGGRFLRWAYSFSSCSSVAPLVAIVSFSSLLYMPQCQESHHSTVLEHFMVYRASSRCGSLLLLVACSTERTSERKTTCIDGIADGLSSIDYRLYIWFVLCTVRVSWHRLCLSLSVWILHVDPCLPLLFVASIADTLLTS